MPHSMSDELTKKKTEKTRHTYEKKRHWKTMLVPHMKKIFLFSILPRCCFLPGGINYTVDTQMGFAATFYPGSDPKIFDRTV